MGIYSILQVQLCNQLCPYDGCHNIIKASSVAISETLYSELFDAGIHVSCIQPTYFRTNIWLIQ